MGMPLNAAADKAADAGAEAEHTPPDIEGLQALPMQFRSRVAPSMAPTSAFTRERSHVAAMPDPPDAGSTTADPARRATSFGNRNLLREYIWMETVPEGGGASRMAALPPSNG
eukprot:240401-Rhodomonas_salina.1